MHLRALSIFNHTYEALTPAAYEEKSAKKKRKDKNVVALSGWQMPVKRHR
jgi:hypothetical protein